MCEEFSNPNLMVSFSPVKPDARAPKNIDGVSVTQLEANVRYTTFVTAVKFVFIIIFLCSGIS